MRPLQTAETRTAISAVLAARPVAASIDELLAGSARSPMGRTAESRSDALFEHVDVAGQPMVLKHLCVDHDWTMRAMGDLGCRPIEMWRLGLLDALPECIDHTMVGCARWHTERGRPAGAVLMRDVGDHIVRDTAPVTLEQHRGFLDHMAALHAAFWGWRDRHGLMALSQRYLMLSPAMARLEARLGGSNPVPAGVLAGWLRVAERAPRTAALVAGLLADPLPLVGALEDMPATLVHGDFKFGNLGSHADGRTILLDWAMPGEAPPGVDLAWYVCTNCDRLPESKEATITAYRAALERCGIETDGWWDRQIGLCLVGAFLQQGWTKAGDPAELAWWEARVSDGVRYLG